MGVRIRKRTQPKRFLRKNWFITWLPLELFDRLKQQQLLSPGMLFTILLILIPIGIWLGYQPRSLQNPLIAVAKFNAFMAISTLSVNFILATRLKLFEKLFYGLDRMYRVHKVVGRLSLIFIILHPLFLILFRLTQQRTILPFILPIGRLEVSAGVLAVYIFVILLLLTVSFQLPYHWWHNSHKLLGIVLIFSSYHAIVAGSDINSFFYLKWWVVFISAVGIASWLYMLLFYKKIGPKYHVRIQNVKHYESITELYFNKPAHFSFQPGQFIFVRFPRFEGYKELFPFSLSNAPSEETLRVSIKQNGDYTSKNIPKLKKGDKAILMGPYGTFGQRCLKHNQDMVWIAGGIGITPFLSLAAHESLHPTGRNIRLIWVAKNKNDAFHSNELVATMKTNPSFSYIHWFSNEQGTITADDILHILGKEKPLKNYLFFMCGPPPMMYALSKGLHKKGVSYRHIIFEDFNMLD